MHTDTTPDTSHPSAVSTTDGGSPDAAKADILHEAPLPAHFRQYPHALYTDATSGATTITVGDVTLQAPAKVVLPERRAWDADLIRPAPYVPPAR